MERRDFIRTSAVAAAGLAISEWNGFGSVADAQTHFEAISAAWTLYDDGSYTMTAGDIVLSQCYPAFDGKPVFSRSVEVKRQNGGGEITYILKEGKIILTFAVEGTTPVLRSVLDMPVTPHYFYPLGFAVVSGADRYVKQGLGFAGPCGVFEFPKTPVKRESHQHDEAWSYDSYLVSGFCSGNDQSLAIGAYKHDNYLQRSTYYNRTYRFGLIDRHLNENTIMFEAGFGTEGIAPDTPVAIPELYFLAGTQPFAVFRQFAENMAKANAVVLKAKPRYQWCSWYEFESNYTQAHLDELIAGLKTIKPALPIEALQIDDGYAERGDWLIPNTDRFPKGLGHMVKSITSAGYQAGIWLGPFMVSERSKVFREHPEWILRDLDDQMFVEGVFPEGKHYVLDTTHPQAFEYLRSVFRGFRKMGITYYKTDFMDWGVRDRNKFKRYDNKKTGVQNFSEVVRMIRGEIGVESYWLGCIAPFPPLVGYADAVRFSNDIPAQWNDGSQGNLIQEGKARHIFQHVLWQNDPDTVFLRDANSNLNSKLSADELYTIALFDGMIGGFVMTSDRFHKISPEYLKLWRFLQPGKQQVPSRFPFWAGQKKLCTVVRDFPDGNSWAVLVTNPTAETISEEYSVKDLIGTDKGWFFSWKPGESSPAGELSTLKVELKPHQSILYYVNRKNTAPAKDLGIAGIPVKGLISEK